jgi:hypothetical protein
VGDAIRGRVQGGDAEQQRRDQREEDRKADDAVAQDARLRRQSVGALLGRGLLFSDGASPGDS